MSIPEGVPPAFGYSSHSILSEESKENGYSKIRVKLNQIFERFVVKHADYVIALSENTFKFYKKWNTNIELIPVFVDDNLFRANTNIRRGQHIKDHKIIKNHYQ